MISYAKKYIVIVLLILLSCVLLAVEVLAETESVHISGSLDVSSIYRRNIDLRDGNDQGAVPQGGAVQGADHSGQVDDGSESDNFYLSTAELRVDAELTDKVSIVFNVLNERDWNARAFQDAGLDSTGANPNISAGDENDLGEFDVVMDLAYVQLKEIGYEPLTLKLGRQDIMFGRGNIFALNRQDPNNAISADELTAVNSFDALRATLDFNPWTVDWVAAYIDENAIDAEDDTQFYFANINYQFSQYNAEAEVYVGSQDNRGAIRRTTTSSETGDRLWILGGRTQFDPIQQMSLGAEVAYQFGDYAQSAGSHRDRSAWFIEGFGEYSFNNVWRPTLGLQYVHFSGENNFSSGTDEYNAWNSLYRGAVFGDIRDFAENFYETASIRDQAAGTNQNHVALYGSIFPADDLLIDFWWYYFWADEDYLDTGTSGNPIGDEIGQELDIHATYDYTEDVDFVVGLAWFFPGEVYESSSDSSATQAISRLNVTF